MATTGSQHVGDEPIASNTHCVHAKRPANAFEIQARAVSRLAALFHDIGKNSAWFQEKLRLSTKVGPVADLVRHEFISFIVLSALFNDYGSDLECLDAMSAPHMAADIIERAFNRAFKSPETYAFNIAKAPRLSLFVANITRADTTDAADINLPSFAKRPIFSLLSDAILTHHRLTGARFNKVEDTVVPTVEHLIAKRGQVTKRDIEKLFEFPPNLVPLWEDRDWVSEMASACSGLAATASQGIVLSRKAFSIIGRTALVLADHKASAYGSRAFPPTGAGSDPTLAYANTNKSSRRGELAEPLGSHMVRVSKDCSLAYDILFAHAGEFPGIPHNHLPTAITEPLAERNTPFRWQTDASHATRMSVGENGQSGFFGVLMADTGAGKTRAASIIMAAASGSEAPLRLSVCSGLRTLTLQTGREYTEELRYPNDSVSVVIGDELTADLYRHETREADTGSETDDLVGVDVVRMDSAHNERCLPQSAHAFVGDSLSSATVGLLTAPVLISTIDTIMPAADGRRAGQMAKTLRVATSDLIVDEIDNFGDEDIVAIARLVFLHAAFGRRVLVSSATVYPEIAASLYESYRAGWDVHRSITERDAPLFTGWYSNTADCRCAEIDSSEAFSMGHYDFVTEILSKGLPFRRRARISATVNPDSAGDYFGAVSNEIKRLHDDNHVVDGKTGRRVSVGVIKWNNALPSMLYSVRLSKEGLGDDVDVLVVPYNGTLQAGPRHIVERNLNRMLRRKPRGRVDPVLADEVVREALDKRAKTEDVVIVVVTTSMEETGRDHDFDWAILEPGSQRSLIQIAGRVRRHRMGKYQTQNVVVMERAFREARNNQMRVPSAPVFAYPGFEKPSIPSAIDFRLQDHNAAKCYDIDTLSNGIDSRDAISIALPLSAIGNAERRLTAAYLDGSIAQDRAGVCHFLDDDLAFIHGHNMFNRRFRRPSGNDFTFVYQSDGDGWGVLIGNVIQNCNKMTELDPDESRLLIQLPSEDELRDSLAAEMWGVDVNVETWKRHALLAVTRPLHAKTPHAGRYLYHRALGFIERPTWLDKLVLM